MFTTCCKSDTSAFVFLVTGTINERHFSKYRGLMGFSGGLS